MKKIRVLFLPLIIIALFSLNSCGGADEPIDGLVENTDTNTSLTNPDNPANPSNPSNPTNPTTSSSSTILLKKTISIDPTGEEFVSIYNYNGIRLVSIIEDAGGVNTFVTYTGDLITKLEYKNSNGTLEQVDSFTYNADGKLASFVREVITSGNLGTFIDTKEVYTHNTDGSISVKVDSGSNLTRTIKFVNGEVSEITNSTSENHKYVYDAKNSPMKNVLGWGKIAFVDGEAGGILHNTISDTSGSEVWSCIYTYNSNSYPVTANETDENGEKHSLQLFY